jgi:hypothetical protein
MVDFVVKKLIICVYSAANGSAEEDCKKRKGRGDGGPVPVLSKDDGDAAELHVEDTIAETSVERDEEADWRAEELNWSEEELLREIPKRDVPFLVFGVQSPVAGCVAEGARFASEESWRVGFVDAQDVDDEDGGLQDASEVFGPAPAERGIGDECRGDNRA